MSDFEKYIEAKYPNRSPKILFQKFKDIDGTLFYGIKEVEDQAEAWNHQQAKIDELQKRIDGALFEMQQLSLMLSKDIDGYEDPAQICQSEGVDMGVRILEKALRGAND